MSNQVVITSDAVPASFCPIGDADWQLLIRLLHGEVSSSVGFTRGNSTPAPTDRDKPWDRLNSDGTPDRWYEFALGAWLSLHQLPPGSIMMVEIAEADIPTFDGGEVAAVTAVTGPFWEKVTQLNGRMPIGPGTLTPSGGLINNGDTGGEDVHSLTQIEMPPHTHNTKVDTFTLASGPGTQILRPESIPTIPEAPTSSTGGTGTPAVVSPHNNLPPYYGLFFIRRTARLFFRQSA